MNNFKPGDKVLVHRHDTVFLARYLGTPGLHNGTIKVFVEPNEGSLSVYPHEIEPYTEEDGDLL